MVMADDRPSNELEFSANGLPHAVKIRRAFKQMRARQRFKERS